MKRFLTAAMIASVLSVSGGAQAQWVHILGPGAASCGVWTEALANMLQQKTEMWSALTSWVLGYVSGATSYLAMGDLLRGQNTIGIDTWMSNYCAANPIKSIGDGADVLIRDLIKERSPQRLP